MKIEGIITAMVSPLDEQGIDRAATRRLVNQLIAKGIHGLFILGPMGSFMPYLMLKSSNWQPSL